MTAVDAWLQDHLTGSNLTVRRYDSKEKRHVVPMIGHVFGGQIIYLLCQFGILSSIAHLRGPEATGIFGLSLAVTTPIFILANAGLRTVQTMDQTGDFRFGEYATFRIISTVAALLVSGLVAVAYASDYLILLVILLIASAKAFETLSELSYGAFEQKERPDLVFRSLAIRGVLSVFLFITLLWNGAELWTAFFAQLIVWSVVALALDFPAACRLNNTRPRSLGISRDRFVALFRKAFPVGAAGFAVGLQSSLLRLIVDSTLGLRALGIFTSVSYIFQAGALISNALGYILTARFARFRRDNDHDETRKQGTVAIVLLAILGGLGVLIAYRYGEVLLTVAFGAELSGQVNLLGLITLALSMRLISSVPNSLIYARGGAVNIFWRECGLVVLVVVASYVLIPQFGLIGAGLALLFLSTVRVLIACWVVAFGHKNDQSTPPV